MAINGINSYGMGYYNYQSSINNIRLTQALSKNPRLNGSASSSISSANFPLKSSMNFIKKYTSSMSDLMNAANNLKSVNKSGVMNDLQVTSSDETVASAVKKFSVKNDTDITLNVSQLAQAQTNVSTAVDAAADAQTNMNFSVGNASDIVNVNVSALKENGAAKTNAEMLKEAASQINKNSKSVSAKVIEKDGTASLQLTGTATGTNNGFRVSGELGAAAGAEQTKTAAANAKYSVTSNNKTFDYESASNNVSVDYTRIDVTLKGTGTTKIGAAADTEKVASAVEDLVKAYNSSLQLLNDNYDRGTGVENQLRNLVGGLGSEQSLEKLGITVNKDATLKFDKSVFEKNMKEDPKFTTDLITGTSGIANKAFTKAMAGMNTSSSSLINGDLSGAEADAMSSPYNVFNMYAKSGVYTMSNYGAVGMMMNYLV